MPSTIKQTIPNFLPNTRYTARVRSFNAFGVSSDWSEATAFTTPDTSSIPNAPTNVQFNFDSPNLVISWDPVTANTDNTFFDLGYYELTFTANSITKTYQTSTPYFVYPFALNRSDFTTAQPSIVVSITAVDNFGAMGAYASITAVNIPPVSPTSGPVLSAGYNLIDVYLTTTILDLNDYDVEHSTDNVTWTIISRPTNDFYSHESLTPNTLHYYRFRPVDVFNQGAASYSPSSSIMTLTVVGAPDTISPDTPVITTAIAGTDDNTNLPIIDLAWGPVTSPDLDHYDIQFKKHTNTGWTQYNLQHTVLNFTFNGLDADTDYDVQVRAVDTSSNVSSWAGTTVNSGHGAGTLTLPTALFTTPGVEAIFVSWDANTDPTFDHYDLYASQTVGFTPNPALKIYSGPNTSFVYDVGSGETWYFRLAIVDIYGNGVGNYTAGFAGHSYATSGLTIINTDNFVVTADGTVAARNIVVTGGKIGDVTISNSAETRLTRSITLPVSTIPVFNTTGFPSSATITVGNQTVTYTGLTVNSFTGCTGGTGLQFAGASVYYQGLLSGGLIRGTTFEIGSGGINFTGSGNITWQPTATGKIIVSNTGSIQSANFVTNTSGWSLGPAGLEINNGNIIINTSNYIKSSNYNFGTAGWFLGPSGLEINGGIITAPTFRSSYDLRHLEISDATRDQITFYGGEGAVGESDGANINMAPRDSGVSLIHDTLRIVSNEFTIGVPLSRSVMGLVAQNSVNPSSQINFQAGSYLLTSDSSGDGKITHEGFGGISTLGPISTNGGFKTYSSNNGFWLDFVFPEEVRFIIDGTLISSIYDAGGGVAAIQLSNGAVKNFIIDHPIDKEKYLVHACLEGPESAVYYRGEGQCVNGQSTIFLPDYFEAATKQEGRTIQLTPIRENAQLAAFPVRGGRFKVSSSQPATQFYWEVKAIRSDVLQLDPTPQKNTVEVHGTGPYRWFTPKGK